MEFHTHVDVDAYDPWHVPHYEFDHPATLDLINNHARAIDHVDRLDSINLEMLQHTDYELFDPEAIEKFLMDVVSIRPAVT